MNAALFYQRHETGACLLRMVNALNWQEGLSVEEQQRTSAQGFEGKLGELVYFDDPKGELRMVLVGSGQDELEQAMAIAAVKLPAQSYVVEQPLPNKAVLMWALAQYRFDRYKQNTMLPRRLCLSKEIKTQVLNEARAIFLVRDLINTPTQDMGPADLEKAAHALSVEYHAKLQVIEGEALLKGYPAIHAVGRAACTPPRLICLHWGKARDPRVSLVGKGVCFDSGGLDLKNASGMRLMKKDMGGAAIALGLAQWIMAEGLPVRLEVLIPAVENAIGPNAYRPGEVLRMRNQLTVEIENTDAEGRLVLADALVKACEEKPDLLMDFSTLTGAARIAVGADIAALFSNDDALAADLFASSQKVQDPIWRLPLHSAYQSMLDSSVADLMNSSTSSYAGAITAALFLQRFVDPDISWAHFDMMAWNLSSKPGKPEGGEAMALRAVAHYLKARFS